VKPPPYLISQQGVPSVPSANDLEEALLWDYSFTFAPEGNHSLEVTFNEEQSVAYELDLENVDGNAQIRVTAASGALPLVLLPDMKLVETNDLYRYEKADGTPLTFEEAETIGWRTMVFQRLDVLDVQSARPTIAGQSFQELLIPFLENSTTLPIGGTPGTIAEHLTWLFDTLLGNSPFATQPASIECRYGYELGGMPIEAPVVLVTRQDFAIGFDEELIEQIAGAIAQWLEAVQPPTTNARLIFGLTFWCAIPRTNAPLLRLPNVSLPMSDVK
jgi:hypothetical protein